MRGLLWVLSTLLFASAQTRDIAPEEVRISSAIYSPPPLTLSAQANLVELAVTVRDAKDHAVGGLLKEDFEVFDSGMRQTISVFAANHAGQASPAPAAPARTLALFFDDTHASAPVLEKARDAAARFVASELQPGDRAGIFTTSGAETIDFTSDRQVLGAALALIRPHSSGARPFAGCPALSEFDAYAIARNLEPSIKREAVLQAIACNCPVSGDDPDCPARQPNVVQNIAEMYWEFSRVRSSTALRVLDLVVRHLARAPGRRVLLMLSPGLLLDRMEKQTSAIVDAALRAQIVINGIDAAGLQTNPVAGSRQFVLEEVMGNLSGATGGRLVHDSNDFFTAIQAAAADPENSYVLGFAPTRAPDDAWHPLRVRVTASGGRRVETRPGYFAVVAKKELIQQRLDRIAASADSVTEFPATVAITHGPAQTGTFPIRIEIHVDAGALQFPTQEGRAVQQLTFVTVLEDASGAYVTGRQAVMELALTPARLAELRRDGIKAGLTFHAPKGRYRLRSVVREAAQNRIAAATAELILF
jgi:VWFA-related protein